MMGEFIRDKLPEAVTPLDLADVEPRRRADVALDHVRVRRVQWARENRRPRGLSAREALAALKFEALFVSVVASNLRTGVVLSDADFERLATSCRWIDEIVSEAV